MNTYVDRLKSSLSKIKQVYIEPSIHTVIQKSKLIWNIHKNPIIMSHLRQLSLWLNSQTTMFSREDIINATVNLIKITEYYSNILKQTYAPTLQEVKRVIQLGKVFQSQEEIERFISFSSNLQSVQL